MSEKIYDAFFLDMPIGKVIPFLKECVKRLTPDVTNKLIAGMSDMLYLVALAESIQLRPVSEVMSEHIPYTMKRGNANSVISYMGRDPLFAAYLLSSAWADHNEFVLGRFDVNPKFNISLGVTLFPSRGKTYGMAFGDSDLVASLLQQPELHDYSYWDNVNRPKEISRQAWTARKRIWNKVCPSGVPRAEGLEYKMFPTLRLMYPMLKPENMDSYILSHRQEYVDRLVHEKLVEIIIADQEIPEGGLTVSCYLDISKKAHKEIAEGTQRVQDLQGQFDAIAPRNWLQCEEILKSASEKSNP